MNTNKKSVRFDVLEIKQAAAGRWMEIIPSVTGISADILITTEGPCPLCNGSTRFRVFSDFAKTGGMHCSRCHNKDSHPRNGDGISAIEWLSNCTFPQALQAIGDHLGLSSSGSSDRRDIVADLCRQKQMPIESAKAYGATAATRGRQSVVRFPVYDADGMPTSYSDVSPYSKGKLNKGMLPKGGKAGLHLPGRSPQSGEIWLICEGVKDAAALHGMGYFVAGLTGCNMRREFGELFRGCSVVLVPDLDRASMRGFSKIGSLLEIVVESVSVAMLPGVIQPRQGGDVRDIIKRDGPDAVSLAIDGAAKFDANDMVDGRPVVNIALEDGTEQETADSVIRILASRGFSTADKRNRVFQRGGKLVAVSESDTGPRLAAVDVVGIRERVSAAMDLIEHVETGGELVGILSRPPGWLCMAIAGRASYDHVRFLDGIVTAPTMRADGTILQTPGYDASSRLLYIPDGEYPPIPDAPTQDDAGTAAKELLDIVSDFPFADDAAKSVWLALVLTLLARPAINGNVPLFGFSANIRGSGKSKLCDLAGLIAFGRTMGRNSLTRDDDETRKVITSIAIEAKPAVLFDNVSTAIGSAPLDAALTSDFWSDRILSKSEMTGDLPWRTVMMATGNNLSFRADTARRVVICKLDCLDEHPEDRDDFEHSNLEEFTRSIRHRLAIAGMTILRSFVEAGRTYQGKRLGSFESWSELICGAVVHAGMPNPLDTVSIVRDQDNTGAIFRLLLDGIATAGGSDGLTAREIVDLIKSDDDRVELIPLRTAIAELTDKPTAMRIGNSLRKYQGRVCDGQRLTIRTGRARVRRWVVEDLAPLADSPDPCCHCGEPITRTPTSDGFVNRRCDACDVDFECISAVENVDLNTPADASLF